MVCAAFGCICKHGDRLCCLHCSGACCENGHAYAFSSPWEEKIEEYVNAPCKNAPRIGMNHAALEALEDMRGSFRILAG
jgi:hypothetical protein